MIEIEITHNHLSVFGGDNMFREERRVFSHLWSEFVNGPHVGRPYLVLYRRWPTTEFDEINLTRNGRVERTRLRLF